MSAHAPAGERAGALADDQNGTAAPSTGARRDGPVLALDLGGTHLRTAVVDTDGRLLARRRIRTPLLDGAEAVLDACVATLRQTLMEHAAAGSESPIALGISAPGPLDVRRGILFDPPNLGPTFRDFPLGPRLTEALGIPTHLERDTHVAVLAEGRFGAARGLTDYVYVTVSTGIGGAVVTGGRLMTGPDGLAGELGHITVDMHGPVCGCGAKGHLERLTSGSGIARSAVEALADGRRSPALEATLAAIAPAPLEARHVAAAEDQGDPLAIELLERARQAFAAAMVSFVDIFAPQCVIVGGGVATGQGERLLGPAREAVAAHAFRTQAARVEIVPAALGDDVGLIGALPLVDAASPHNGGTSR